MAPKFTTFSKSVALPRVLKPMIDGTYKTCPQSTWHIDTVQNVGWYLMNLDDKHRAELLHTIVLHRSAQIVTAVTEHVRRNFQGEVAAAKATSKKFGWAHNPQHFGRFWKIRGLDGAIRNPRSNFVFRCTSPAQRATPRQVIVMDAEGRIRF
jgi:hypothetical protein